MKTKTPKFWRQPVHTAAGSPSAAGLRKAQRSAQIAAAVLLSLALAACVTNPQADNGPAPDAAATAAPAQGAASASEASAAPAPTASASAPASVSAKTAVRPKRIEHPVPVARCGPMPRDVNLAHYLGELRAKDEASYDLFELMLLPDGERKLAQRLAQGTNPNVCGGPFQLSLLATAAIGAHAQTMLQLLLDHGAKLDAPLGEAGESALVYAIRANHLGAAQFLLAQGAKADLPFGAGETALSELAKSAKDKDHNTEQELALAAQLLARQLSPNSADTQPGRGMTPLMWAVLTNKPELIALFKAHGGDPSVKNAKGQDAIALAKALKRDEALKALEAP